MARYDATQANAAVERPIQTTENPRHLYLPPRLQPASLSRDGRSYEEIFTPEMTVEHPVYHFNVFGMNVTLDGAEEVKALYREWTETGQCVFHVEGEERLAVGDHVVCSTAMICQQTPGIVLAARGADVDPEATYLVKNVEYMIWPYDDRCRLVGEDVWEIDESRREVIRLEPDEVLTPKRSAELLDPYTSRRSKNSSQTSPDRQL